MLSFIKRGKQNEYWSNRSDNPVGIPAGSRLFKQILRRKFLSEKNVKLIRLRHTPEELICVVVEESPNGLTIEDPFVPVASPDGTQMGLQPWSVFSKKRTFQLTNADVLLVTEPLDALRDGYLDSISPIARVNSIVTPK